MAYYHAVFDPDDLVIPSSEKLAGSVIDVLVDCVANFHENKVGISAVHLLARSAYLQPDHRDEILGRLRATVDDTTFEEARSMVERLVRFQGEALSNDDFRIVLVKSDRELLDFVLQGSVGGTLWRAHWSVLAKRISFSPEREEIALELVSDEQLRNRYSLTPKPISIDAPESDKRLFDQFVEILERNLSSAGEGHKGWPVNALQRMLVNRNISDASSIQGERTLVTQRPYGHERVVKALISALSLQDQKTREMAASALGNIAWLAEDIARAALDALTAENASKGVDSSASTATPGYSHAIFDAAIRKAETALTTFQKSSETIKVVALEYTPPIPPPALPDYASTESVSVTTE